LSGSGIGLVRRSMTTRVSCTIDARAARRRRATVARGLGADAPEGVGQGGARRDARVGGVDDVPAVRGAVPVDVGTVGAVMAVDHPLGQGVADRHHVEVDEQVRAEPGDAAPVAAAVGAPRRRLRVVRVV